MVPAPSTSSHASATVRLEVKKKGYTDGTNEDLSPSVGIQFPKPPQSCFDK